VSDIISNIPKQVRIKMRAASTLRVTCTLKRRNGQPVDLTGSTFTGLILPSTPFSVTLLDGPQGKFQFEITPSDVPGVLETTWQVDQIAPDLSVHPMVAGPFYALA
jgi:hypothetical protein